MAMVDVGTCCKYMRTCGRGWLAWSEGRRPLAAVTFIKWTEQTLPMALSWWQHHKRFIIIIIMSSHSSNGRQVKPWPGMSQLPRHWLTPTSERLPPPQRPQQSRHWQHTGSQWNTLTYLPLQFQPIAVTPPRFSRTGNLFCGCVLFRFCFKPDFLRLHGHRFKTRKISCRPTK